MKKLTAILCALLIASLAATACAEVPTSNLYKPLMSETFKTLVAGKTFEVYVSGWESYGEDEDAKFIIILTACEPTHYEAKAIENLQVRDIIAFKPGEATVVMEVTPDEDGIRVKGGGDDGSYVFTKAEDGSYTVRTDTENIIYTEMFTISIPLEKDISFLDWSDPENLEAPVKKGFNELLDLLLEGRNFAPYNTRVTFDENGKLAEFLYTYSPWN